MRSAPILLATCLLLGACSVFQGETPAPAAETPPPPPPAEAAAAPAPAPEPSAPAARGPFRYACHGSRTTLTVSYPAGAATARLGFGKESLTARRAQAASGARYTAGRNTEFWEKGGTANLTWKGKKYTCRAKA